MVASIVPVIGGVLALVLFPTGQVDADGIDIGGIVGLHFQEELRLQTPIISIDGIALSDFDFIDIGALIQSSGAVPVVIKSLIFPANAALGKVPETVGKGVR